MGKFPSTQSLLCILLPGLLREYIYYHTAYFTIEKNISFETLSQITLP